MKRVAGLVTGNVLAETTDIEAAKMAITALDGVDRGMILLVAFANKYCFDEVGLGF
jgi:hypothetical protein